MRKNNVTSIINCQLESIFLCFQDLLIHNILLASIYSVVMNLHDVCQVLLQGIHGYII